MADVCDRADEAIQANLEAALQQSRGRQTPLSPVGQCHACGAPLRSGVFCDAECKDDWEYIEAAKRRNGGR